MLLVFTPALSIVFNPIFGLLSLFLNWFILS